MKNIEKYKDEILKYAGYQYSLMCLIYENIMKKNDCTGCCSKCKRETIKWLTSEYEEPILTDKEKAIIKYIIKSFEPFDGELEYIVKESWGSGESRHYLNFSYKNNATISPSFNKDKFFTNMELNKKYSLEELEL